MSTTEVRNLQDRAEGQQRAVALGLALEDKQEERKTLVSENGRVGRRRSVMNSDTDSIETNKDEDDYQENAVEEGDGDGNGNADEVDGDRDGNGDGDGDGDEDEDGITGYKADLLFTKKDVKRGRTQSFQSVLSSASLKSLKQQTTSMSSNHPRSNSIISTASNANGGVTSKNFQSFIQAPVLSNISDLKNNDDVEIGQQLPFVDSKAKDSNGTNSSNEKSINSDDLEDQEIIWQQQNLTMNALKKLSLSPMPIHNDDNGNGSGGGNVGSSSISKTSSRAVSRKSSVAKIPTMERIIEPYKPAEVDLSTFASLTRQPKAGIPQVAQETQSQLQQPQKSQYQPQSQPQSQPQPQPQQKPQQPQQQQHSSPEQEQVQAQVKSQIQTQHASQAQLQPSQTSQTSQQMSTQSLGPGAPLSGLNPQLSAYHKELQENHLRSLKQQPTKIPAAVIPPQNMNIRRSLLLHMVKPQDSNSSHANSEFLNNESPNTPSNTSNTPSSSLQLKHLQQIKGFRSPMYIPAVLRKTGAERNNGSGCGMTNCESVESTSSISTNGVSNGTSKSNGQNTPAENGGDQETIVKFQNLPIFHLDHQYHQLNRMIPLVILFHQDYTGMNIINIAIIITINIIILGILQLVVIG